MHAIQSKEKTFYLDLKCELVIFIGQNNHSGYHMYTFFERFKIFDYLVDK